MNEGIMNPKQCTESRTIKEINTEGLMIAHTYKED